MMKTKSRGIWRRSASLMLACALVLSGLVLFREAGTVNAATSKDREEFKNNKDVQKYEQTISDLAKKQKDLKNQISSLNDDIDDLMQKKALYDEMAEIYADKIAASESLIEALSEQIKETEASIKEKQAETEVLYEQIKERMRAADDGGSGSYLEMIFGADSLSDFLIGLDNAVSILDYDTRLLEELNEMKTSLEAQQEQLEASIEEQNATKESLEADKADAEKTSAQCDAMLTQALNDKAKNEQLLKKYEQEEAATNKKLEAFIDDLISKRGTTQVVAEGKYMWPLPTNYKTITSNFGSRTDPFGSGATTNHGGTDIYCPVGTKVYASNNGTVIKAEKDSSYGYYILIDHGGDIFTLYAHCNKLLVSVGTYVKKGTVIAESGKTGHVTGPHLHFEVREGKTRVNALKYVKVP